MAEQSALPTIVLVHGAFAESASWNGVIRGLRGAGFRAVAVANPLRGVRRDAEALQAVVSGVPGDLVLVAHSYGGMLISNVDDPRIRSRVYMGAFAPDAGESAGDLAGRFPGSTLADTLEQFPLPGGEVDLSIRQDLYHAQFAADSSKDDAAVMAVTQRPVTAAALAEASPNAFWRAAPTWFLFGSHDRNIPVAAHRFMAERAGSRRTVELQGGSHTVAIPEAPTAVELIREAAAAAA